jgi:hypothetical protein
VTNFKSDEGDWIMEYSSVLAVKGLDACPELTEPFVEHLFGSILKINKLLVDQRRFGQKVDDFTGQAEIAQKISYWIFKLLREVTVRSPTPIRRLANLLQFETPIFESVLGPNVDVTPFAVLPVFGFICSRGDHSLLQIVPDLERFIDPVVKWCAVSSLASFGLFVRNPDSFIRISGNSTWQSNLEHRLFPSFALIQTAFGLSRDKHRFLTYIARIFGLFHREPCDDEGPVIRNIEFACLHFILCLIFDRSSLSDDLATARGMIVVTRLTHTPTLSLKDFSDIFGPRALRDQKFLADMATYTTMVQTRNQLLFRIRDGVEWHPLLPFVKLPWILDAMNGFSSKNPHALVPFPEFSLARRGLDLRCAFVTPLVFGFSYHLLSDFVHLPDRVSVESLHLVCNLLVCIANLFPDLTGAAASFADLPALLDGMPAALDAPIAYRERAPASLLDLLARAGPLGQVALDRLHVRVAPSAPVDPKAARRRALEVRRSVMSTFKTQQDAFLASAEEEDEQPNECLVCRLHRPDECFGFPVFAFKTVLPAFAQARVEDAPFAAQETVSGIHLCEHLVHLSCFRSRDSSRCAIDRGRRNAILPKIDSDTPNESEIAADTRFMREVFDEAAVVALRSLAGEVSLLEIRARARLDCLEKSATATKFFYLFMCVRRFARGAEIAGMPADAAEALLRALLQCDALPRSAGEFAAMAQACVTPEMGARACLAFLRRAFIIEQLVLRIGVDRFMNWQDALSVAKLVEHFAMPPLEGNVVLQQFSFHELPQRFLDFVLPPYRADLSHVSKEIGMCLLTGKVIDRSYRRSTLRDDLSDHITRELGRTFTPWLVLTGAEATAVAIVSWGLFAKFRMKSVYVDSLGYEDRGLARGQILKLSRENLDAVIETVLSGEWIDCEV